MRLRRTPTSTNRPADRPASTSGRWAGRRAARAVGASAVAAGAAVLVAVAFAGAAPAAVLSTTPVGDAAPAAPAVGRSSGGSPGGDPSVVRVADGVLQGAVHTDGRLFADIPYAAPPVGALRWRFPQPAQPWSGTRNATWPGPACAQTAGDMNGGVGSTSEDCLTLNVYTPPVAQRSGPLPVMVWIHGGAFVSGSGSAYNASVIATRGKAVVVTINYRLGPFGFLVTKGLDGESPDGASGNYGLADQQAALRWVQANVARFGGNRRNVTIFGESAGATSVCDQLASPTAAGLFQRAIAESGCSSLDLPRASAEQRGQQVATSLGCTDAATQVACLRAKPVADLLQASTGAATSLTSYAPSAGDRLLPQPVATALAAGRFNRVPVILGTNHDEGTFLTQLILGTYQLTDDTYNYALSVQYGATWPAVAAQYPAKNYASPNLALAATITDSTLTCPALSSDQAIARRAPVYAYEFDDPHAPALLPPALPLGAYHTAELQYVFDRTPVLSLVPDFTPQQQALSAQMIRYWTRFAHYGTPDQLDQPLWPLTLSGRALSLDPAGSHAVTLDSIASDHNCGFWSSQPVPTS
jgi:para-nitrobenzyl esterase